MAKDGPKKNEAKMLMIMNDGMVTFKSVDTTQYALASGSTDRARIDTARESIDADITNKGLGHIVNFSRVSEEAALLRAATSVDWMKSYQPDMTEETVYKRGVISINKKGVGDGK